MVSTKVYTLALLHRGSQVLLGYKKRGFGLGKWNGFGGKIEPTDKSIEAAAIREVEEECGIKCNQLEYMAKLIFEFEPGSTQDELPLMEVHLFKGTNKDFSGEAKETQEMRPEWFEIENVVFDQMWPDDKYWWPIYLKHHKFNAYFKYRGYDTITHHKIDIINDN